MGVLSMQEVKTLHCIIDDVDAQYYRILGRELSELRIIALMINLVVFKGNDCGIDR